LLREATKKLAELEREKAERDEAFAPAATPLKIMTFGERVRLLLEEHSPAEVLLAVATAIDAHADRFTEDAHFRADARAVRGVLGQLAETSSKAFS
jgi:hypothetical protein